MDGERPTDIASACVALATQISDANVNVVRLACDLVEAVFEQQADEVAVESWLPLALPLAEALGSAKPAVRASAMAAALALARATGAEAALSALWGSGSERLMRHRNWRVREGLLGVYSAVNAASPTRPWPATDAILPAGAAALADAQPEVRRAGEEALAHLAVLAGLPRVIGGLQTAAAPAKATQLAAIAARCKELGGGTGSVAPQAAASTRRAVVGGPAASRGVADAVAQRQAAAAPARAPSQPSATTSRPLLPRVDDAFNGAAPTATPRSALTSTAARGAPPSATSARPTIVLPSHSTSSSTVEPAVGASSVTTQVPSTMSAGATYSDIASDPCVRSLVAIHSSPYWRPAALGFGIGASSGAPPAPIYAPSIAAVSRAFDDIATACATNLPDWKLRVAALERLRGLIAGGAPSIDGFAALVPRLLHPLVAQVQDLRSSVVRAACAAVAELSAAMASVDGRGSSDAAENASPPTSAGSGGGGSGGAFEPLADALLDTLLRQTVVTIAIVATSATAAATSIVHNTVGGYHRALPRLAAAASRHKSPVLRSAAATLLMRALRGWEPSTSLDRHADEVCAAVSAMVGDADAAVRATGRRALWSLLALYPDRARAIVTSRFEGDALGLQLLETERSAALVDAAVALGEALGMPPPPPGDDWLPSQGDDEEYASRDWTRAEPAAPVGAQPAQRRLATASGGVRGDAAAPLAVDGGPALLTPREAPASLAGGPQSRTTSGMASGGSRRAAATGAAVHGGGARASSSGPATSRTARSNSTSSSTGADAVDGGSAAAVDYGQTSRAQNHVRQPRVTAAAAAPLSAVAAYTSGTVVAGFAPPRGSAAPAVVSSSTTPAQRRPRAATADAAAANRSSIDEDVGPDPMPLLRTAVAALLGAAAAATDAADEAAAAARAASSAVRTRVPSASMSNERRAAAAAASHAAATSAALRAHYSHLIDALVRTRAISPQSVLRAYADAGTVGDIGGEAENAAQEEALWAAVPPTVRSCLADAAATAASGRQTRGRVSGSTGGGSLRSLLRETSLTAADAISARISSRAALALADVIAAGGFLRLLSASLTLPSTGAEPDSNGGDDDSFGSPRTDALALIFMLLDTTVTTREITASVRQPAAAQHAITPAVDQLLPPQLVQRLRDAPSARHDDIADDAHSIGAASPVRVSAAFAVGGDDTKGNAEAVVPVYATPLINADTAPPPGMGEAPDGDDDDDPFQDVFSELLRARSSAAEGGDVSPLVRELSKRALAAFRRAYSQGVLIDCTLAELERAARAAESAAVAPREQPLPLLPSLVHATSCAMLLFSVLSEEGGAARFVADGEDDAGAEPPERLHAALAIAARILDSAASVSVTAEADGDIAAVASRFAAYVDSLYRNIAESHADAAAAAVAALTDGELCAFTSAAAAASDTHGRYAPSAPNFPIASLAAAAAAVLSGGPDSGISKPSKRTEATTSDRTAATAAASTMRDAAALQDEGAAARARAAAARSSAASYSAQPLPPRSGVSSVASDRGASRPVLELPASSRAAVPSRFGEAPVPAPSVAPPSNGRLHDVPVTRVIAGPAAATAASSSSRPTGALAAAAGILASAIADRSTAGPPIRAAPSATSTAQLEPRSASTPFVTSASILGAAAATATGGTTLPFPVSHVTLRRALPLLVAGSGRSFNRDECLRGLHAVGRAVEAPASAAAGQQHHQRPADAAAIAPPASHANDAEWWQLWRTALVGDDAGDGGTRGVIGLAALRPVVDAPDFMTTQTALSVVRKAARHAPGYLAPLAPQLFAGLFLAAAGGGGGDDDDDAPPSPPPEIRTVFDKTVDEVAERLPYDVLLPALAGAVKQLLVSLPVATKQVAAAMALAALTRVLPQAPASLLLRELERGALLTAAVQPVAAALEGCTGTDESATQLRAAAVSLLAELTATLGNAFLKAAARELVTSPERALLRSGAEAAGWPSAVISDLSAAR